MMVMSLGILAGMWLERFILVAPSLWRQNGFPLGATEVLVTVGYLGIVGLCIGAFLGRVPIVPVSDPLFMESIRMKETRLEP